MSVSFQKYLSGNVLSPVCVDTVQCIESNNVGGLGTEVAAFKMHHNIIN